MQWQDFNLLKILLKNSCQNIKLNLNDVKIRGEKERKKMKIKKK